MESIIHSIKKEIDSLSFSISWMSNNPDWWIDKIEKFENKVKYLEQLLFEFENGQLSLSELYYHATQVSD